MLRVPDHAQRPTRYAWRPAELVQTNDLVLVSAIEALLTQAHIPYLVTDRNVSAVGGSIAAFPRRIIVGECCVADACRLLAAANFGRQFLATEGKP